MIKPRCITSCRPSLWFSLAALLNRGWKQQSVVERSAALCCVTLFSTVMASTAELPTKDSQPILCSKRLDGGHYCHLFHTWPADLCMCSFTPPFLKVVAPSCLGLIWLYLSAVVGFYLTEKIGTSAIVCSLVLPFSHLSFHPIWLSCECFCSKFSLFCVYLIWSVVWYCKISFITIL